jgi:hypothetical protein
MKPTSKREEEIVERVDQKARAIRDGVGAWDNRIVTQMKIAVGFQMSVAEEQFLESYVAWRRQNPIKEWWLAESRKHREPGPLLLFGIIDL